MTSAKIGDEAITTATTMKWITWKTIEASTKTGMCVVLDYKTCLVDAADCDEKFNVICDKM